MIACLSPGYCPPSSPCEQHRSPGMFQRRVSLQVLRQMQSLPCPVASVDDVWLKILQNWCSCLYYTGVRHAAKANFNCVLAQSFVQRRAFNFGEVRTHQSQELSTDTCSALLQNGRLNQVIVLFLCFFPSSLVGMIEGTNGRRITCELILAG